jgi:hypothetical protein
MRVAGPWILPALPGLRINRGSKTGKPLAMLHIAFEKVTLIKRDRP